MRSLSASSCSGRPRLRTRSSTRRRSSAPSRTTPAPSCRRDRDARRTRIRASLPDQTDDNGNFEFFTVRIGPYMVTAESGLLDRGRRQRAGHGRRPAARRPVAAGRAGQRARRGHRAATALETDTSQRGQVVTGDQSGRLAAERPRVLGARAADGRRPRVGAQHRAARRARGRSTSTACAARSTTS